MRTVSRTFAAWRLVLAAEAFALVSAVRAETPDPVRVTRPLLTFRAGFDAYRTYQAKAGWTQEVFRVSHAATDPHACWIVPNNFAGQRPFKPTEAIVIRTSPAHPGYLVVALRSEKTGRELRFNGDWGREASVVKTPGLDPADAYTLSCVTFGFADAKSPHAFDVREIAGVQLSPVAEAISFDVETENSLRMLTNASARASLVFGNPSDRPVSATGVVKGVDFFGRSLVREIALSLSPGETKRIAFGPFPGMGLWRLTSELVSSDGSRATKRTRLAILDPQPVTPRLKDGKFRMGAVCHLERHADSERRQCLELAAALGMKILRADLFAMERVQPNGPDDWQVAHDSRILDELDAFGLDLDAIIHQTPKWAAPEENREKPWPKRAFGPTRPGLFETYCERLAREFGTRIAYYEIGNEWDLGAKGVLEIDEAVRMQAEAYRGIKRGCPKAVVCSNGFAAEGDNQQVQKKGFHEAFLNRAKGTFDVHAIHIHGGFSAYARAIRGDFFSLRRRTGTTAPWYSNETATLPCFGAEDSAARAVWQKILFAWAHGSRDYCWYNLESGSWREGGSDWGLYTAGWMPRATAAAFASLTKTFSGLDFHKVLVDKGARHAYVFGDGRRLVLAGWDSGASAVCEIPVRTDARRAESVDLMGNRTALEIRNGVVVFRLDATPSALVLTDVTRAEPDRERMETPAIPSVAAQIIPDGPASGRKPDFTVDTLNAVHSLFAANPLTESRDWKGPEDLSARAWLGLSKTALQILVEVTDDIHVQCERGGRLYLGDSVQVAFRSYEQDGDWLFGLSRTDDGQNDVFVWTAPTGVDTAAAAVATRLKTERAGDRTRYALSVPYETLGLSPEVLRRSGLRFNFMVNDNDGEGRDGWIECAPGISTGRDSTLYPFVRFQSGLTSVHEAERSIVSGGRTVFARGEHRFDAETGRLVRLDPSNNASGERRVAFCLQGLNDVEIDGGGSTFVLHEAVSPFAILGCTNVTIRNLTVRTERPPYVVFRVGRKEDDGFHLELEKEFDDLPLTGRHLCFHSLDRGLQDYYMAPDDPESRDWVPTRYLSGTLERREGRRRFFRYRPETHARYSKCRFETGERVCLNLAGNRESIFCFAEDSRNVRLEDVTFLTFGGMGVVAQRTQDVSVRRLVVRPTPGLPVTLTADALHFINCAGDIHIEDCEIAGTLDDACNVHGNYLEVVSATGRSAVVKVGHFEQAGFFPYRAGDEVEFIIRRSRDILKKTRVVAFERLSDTTGRLTVDAALGDVPVGALVEDVTLCPNVTLRGNWLHDFPHVRLSGRGRILMEGNRIERCEDGLIAFDLAEYWYESGRLADLTVRNNTFDSCSGRGGSGPYLRIGMTGYEDNEKDAPLIHGCVRLENNRYCGLTGRPFSAFGVKNLSVREVGAR